MNFQVLLFACLAKLALSQQEACTLPEIDCLAIRGYAYRYNRETNTCEYNSYCSNGPFNHPTKESCERACVKKQPDLRRVCKLQKDVGDWCSAEWEDSDGALTYRNRYYFDTRSGKCRGFYYKGCHGNANRFRTISACRSKCENKSHHQRKPTIRPNPQRPAFCYKPAEVGLCKASIRRFYYHADSGTCKIFYYGGCGGNENNFEKKADCVITCLAKNDVE